MEMVLLCAWPPLHNMHQINCFFVLFLFVCVCVCVYVCVCVCVCVGGGGGGGGGLHGHAVDREPLFFNKYTIDKDMTSFT